MDGSAETRTFSDMAEGRRTYRGGMAVRLTGEPASGAVHWNRRAFWWLPFSSYSLWISSGWILVYFIPGELGLWLQTGRYLPLGALAVIAWNAARWPALGFLMGHFYPAIRGANGLWKGLAVAVTFIVPWCTLELLLQSVGDLDSWQPFVVWALQAFVTSVLTGFLAGEVRTLRIAGYGWGDLTNVHNCSTLAAWGSSLAVAVIGAVVTLLATTIGQAVTSQLGGGGPDHQGRRSRSGLIRLSFYP